MMQYIEFVNLYENLSKTASRLEKTHILSDFLKKLKLHGEHQWIYLLKGRVFPEYDPREFGISDKITIKSISKSSGVSEVEIMKRYKKIGDLGELAELLMEKRRQSTLFSSKLSTKKVFENLKKLVEIQ